MTQESSKGLLADHAALHETLQATLSAIRRRRAACGRDGEPSSGETASSF